MFIIVGCGALLVVVERPLEHPSLAWSFSCDSAGMVEAQLIELATAVQNVQAQLMVESASASGAIETSFW